MHPKFFQVLTVVLQYSLLALIVYFLFRTIKVIYLDISQQDYESHYLSHPVSSTKGKKKPVLPVLIVVEQGQLPQDITAIQINEAVSIGRGHENDIVVQEAIVSHEHACITKRKNEYWLTDLHSTNGTYCNSALIDGDVLLKHQDIIKIGSTTFRFEE